MMTQDRFHLTFRWGRLADYLVAGLIGLAFIVGLASDAGSVPRDEEIPFGEGVLWQVQRPGEEPSYVFGTIHMNREDILAVPEAVKSALNDARSASFEIEFDERTAEAIARFTLTGGRKTLDALLGPDLFAEVVEAAEPYGLSVHHVRHFKPWAVFMMFGKPPSIVEDEEETNGKPILDGWLYEQAEERGIPTYGLESVRQHLSPFLDISLEDQRRLVQAALMGLEGDQTEVERRHTELVRRYLDGELGTIIASFDEDIPAEYEDVITDFNRRLLEDRNHLMVERMLPQLKKGKAFVAVGAAHLPGNEGIIALLGEHGYQAQRLH